MSPWQFLAILALKLFTYPFTYPWRKRSAFTGGKGRRRRRRRRGQKLRMRGGVERGTKAEDRVMGGTLRRRTSEQPRGTHSVLSCLLQPHSVFWPPLMDPLSFCPSLDSTPHPQFLSSSSSFPSCPVNTLLLRQG